jgi:hypothetical protein
MVVVAQLVRASVCGTEGRGFETHLPPRKSPVYPGFFFDKNLEFKFQENKCCIEAPPKI